MNKGKGKSGIQLRSILIWTIALVMAAGILMPLQAEPSEAADVPSFKNKSSYVAKIHPVYNGRFVMNLRLEANQSVYGYDTLQGSCYGRGYIYYLLWNRSVDKCKLVKLRGADRRVIRVSRPLKVYHGNDITYNTRTNRLVIAHARPDRKRLSVVNPNTLRIIKTHTITLPKNLPGADWSRVRRKGGYNGFNNIAYNAKHRQYVVQLYGTRDFVLLNESFKPVRYIVPTGWDKQVYQGMDSFGDRIVVCNSPKGARRENVLTVYNWRGKYLSKVRLNRKCELESVYHAGSRLYVTYYRAHWEDYRWVLKTKTIRKNGKRVRVRTYGVKWGRYLNRDSYIYRVTGL